MDDLINSFRDAFASFDRPESVVICSVEDDCFDCPDVERILKDLRTADLIQSSEPFFTRFPMDCLNGDAVLHFLPVIVKESLVSNGLRVAESISWMFGDIEYFDDQSMLQIIAPRLNEMQSECISEYLKQLKKIDFQNHYDEHITNALEWWKQHVNSHD